MVRSPPKLIWDLTIDKLSIVSLLLSIVSLFNQKFYKYVKLSFVSNISVYIFLKFKYLIDTKFEIQELT